MNIGVMFSALLVLGHVSHSPANAAAISSAVPLTSAGEVRLDHISIVESGTGDPVILIPGLATPRAVWEEVASELSRTRRVLLVQINGFGGDDPGENLGGGILEGAVADIVAYLNRRQLGRPAVIGHSMGGLISLMLAARYPGSIDRLMVVDALPFFAVQLAPPGTNISAAQVEPTARQMRENVAAAYGRAPDAAAAAQAVQALALNPGSRTRMQAWAIAADARVAGQAIFENLTTDLRPELPLISVPITMVYPWSAQGLPRERLDTFYRSQFEGARQVRFVDVPEAGHFLMLDQPDRFRAEVNAFLGRSQPQADAAALLSACQGKDGWDDPAPPARIHGGTYYVGTCGISAILITGPRGHVLIDGGTERAAPLIAANVARLGFRMRDVRLILNSHEHHDHAGGIAALQRLSGGTVRVRAEARAAFTSGRPQAGDPQFGILDPFPGVAVGRGLRDGEVVRLGPIRVTAYATPGHSPGSTSWSWQSCEGRICHDLVYADSVSAISAEDYSFSAHPDYVATFRRSLVRIGTLRCDLLLTPHPSASQFFERLASGRLTAAGACRDYAAGGSTRLDARIAGEGAR